MIHHVWKHSRLQQHPTWDTERLVDRGHLPGVRVLGLAADGLLGNVAVHSDVDAAARHRFPVQGPREAAWRSALSRARKARWDPYFKAAWSRNDHSLRSICRRRNTNINQRCFCSTEPRQVEMCFISHLKRIISDFSPWYCLTWHHHCGLSRSVSLCHWVEGHAGEGSLIWRSHRCEQYGGVSRKQPAAVEPGGGADGEAVGQTLQLCHGSIHGEHLLAYRLFVGFYNKHLTWTVWKSKTTC